MAGIDGDKLGSFSFPASSLYAVLKRSALRGSFLVMGDM
jgi:hypothetical protein